MSDNEYDWAVVGGGPAGIAAVGKLLDNKVNAKRILWIDPEFEVGDFGQKWLNIPSNTKVGLFQRFLHEVVSFDFRQVHHQFELSELDIGDTCLLKYMVTPLKWVTKRLRERVQSIQGNVDHLQLHNGMWQLTIADKQLRAKQVILATGSEPKTLEYYDRVQPIDLSIAMNPELLSAECKGMERVAVFGSSHSAILALRNLVEAGVPNIINFYKSPLRYAVYFDDWIMYDDTGLKGSTAEWAHGHIDHDAVPGLERYYSSEQNINKYLSTCQRVIYAVGFERRQSLTITGLPAISYDRRSGIIAPGLFGFGIAYPESYVTPLGNVAHRVGLWKFLDYLNRIMPLWLQYHA